MIIPTELLEYRQWVNRDAQKMPCDPRSHRPARVNDPSTWVDYRLADKHRWRYEGRVSFVLTNTDPFCAIDLDRCLDQATKQPSDFAQRIVREMNSYTEVSPSGRGLRILVKAQLPPGRRKLDHIELYDDKRAVSITGDHLAGTPTTIEPRQELILRLHMELFPALAKPLPSQQFEYRPLAISDAQLITKAKEYDKSGLFAQAWAGNLTSWTARGRADHSRADYYLVNRLVYWTDGDPVRVDRLFRQSGLYREKWDRMHGNRTYGQYQIDHALAEYRPQKVHRYEHTLEHR